MTTPSTIASRLALACGLGWGRWAAGLTKPGAQESQGPTATRCHWNADDGDRCVLDVNHDGLCVFDVDSSPVPDPLDAAAYLADCRRRDVEPGPMPALAWEGDGIRWTVIASGVSIGVGDDAGDVVAYRWSDKSSTWLVAGNGTAEQLATLARLVAAADGGV